MKTFLVLTAAMMSITAICATLDPREWTSSKGDKITATFVSEKSGTVTLKTADGKTMAIKLTALSDQDRQWISESTYVPKTHDVKYSIPGVPNLNNKDIFIRDTVRISIRDASNLPLHNNRNTLISNCSIKELGTTLTNKWNKPITTSQGRFICLHWTVKNDSKIENDINLPKVVDANKNIYDAKDGHDFVDMIGTHCSGRERENSTQKVQPGFFLEICNIFEIPKDSIISEVYFPELGYNPSSYNAKTQTSSDSSKSPSWKK